MYRYTTPTIVFSLPFLSSTISVAYINIEQRQKKLIKDLSACTTEDKKLKCKLTQDDTGLFSKGKAIIQLRCKCTDGNAYASKVKEIQIDDVLKDGEI